MYIDSASDYIHCTFQRSTSAKGTVDSKYRFEHLALIHNIKVKTYYTDNHVFNSHSFRDSCTIVGQALLFSGVNAHNQNGIVK